MNQNQKDHFLHWLMYLLVFLCTGPVGIIIWTAYCLVRYDKSEREYEMRKIPIQYRPDIKAMNTEEYLKRTFNRSRTFRNEDGFRTHFYRKRFKRICYIL